MRKITILLTLLICTLFSTVSAWAEETPQTQDDSRKALIASFIKTKNSNLSEENLQNISNSIENISKTYNIPDTLIVAIMWQESTFNPQEISGKCYGLMQAYGPTAEGLGYTKDQMLNSDLNLKYFGAYFSGLLKTFNNDYNLAISAYNQGPGRVKSGNYSTKFLERILEKESKVKSYLGK